MAKKATIKDIAAKAGVSIATVSYYLNGRYKNMSEEVKNRIQAIIKEMGYIPNNLARGLKASNSKTVGIVIPGLYGQISFRVVAGACKVLDEAGYNTSVYISTENLIKERNYVEICLSNQINGILIVPSLQNGQNNLEFLEKVHSSGTPVVTCTRFYKSWENDGVRLNYEESVPLMIDHMFSKGYKKIALFLDVPNTKVIPLTKDIRRKAFIDKTRQIGIEDGEKNIWYEINSKEQALNAMKQFFASEPALCPKAVFAVNSPTLGYALQAARELNISIPNDLGLGGYGGLDWTSYTYPSLTILTQPLDEVGEQGARMLLARINNPSIPPQRMYLRSQLLECGSTDLKL